MKIITFYQSQKLMWSNSTAPIYTFNTEMLPRDINHLSMHAGLCYRLVETKFWMYFLPTAHINGHGVPA